MLFGISLHPIVLKIKREVASLKQNSWFLDDGVAGGNKAGLQAVVDILLSEGPSRGLLLSLDKSRVWSQSQLNNDDPLERGIKLETAEGLKLLGAPIGSARFEEQTVEERISKLEELMEKLALLEDPHTEYVLLRNCLSLLKMSYATRTVYPAGGNKTQFKRFDDAVRRSLERIIGASLTDEQWHQTTLQVSLGGLGLRSAVLHSPGAFLICLRLQTDN